MFENSTFNNGTIFEPFISYMHELANNPFRLFTLALDLIIVTYLIYKFIAYTKKTRAWQLLKGIILVLIVMAISQVLELKILNFILNFFMPYGVIALIVIFQPELRRMLEQLGTNKITKYFGLDKDLLTKSKEDIYKIVIAATELAKTKTGGLIVIERDIQITDIAETGVAVNAEVSPQLLVNLFTPNTPLHDGAVIISKNKIIAAACILPLADDKEIAKEIGTRHRAGLGISKETDAIAIIVSEETGKISVAKDGTLLVDLKEDALKNILMKNVVNRRFDANAQKKKIIIRKKLLKKQKNKKEKEKKQIEEKNDNKQKEEKSN